MTHSEYKTYLRSWKWTLKRQAVRWRAWNRCERCRWRRMSAVHHRTYERIGKEPLADLQAICKACHDFVHGKSDYDPCSVPWWQRWLIRLFFKV
jgi:hypothetical protein